MIRVVRKEREFYVYVYLDTRPKKKGVPIYVGKGNRIKGDTVALRAWGHWHANKDGAYFQDSNRFSYSNVFLQRVLTKIRMCGLRPIVRIFVVGTDEAEAFALECKLIKEYGRRDLGVGTLLNMTDGGEGACGSVCSPEVVARQNAIVAESNRRRAGMKYDKTSAASLGRGAKISKALTGRKQPRELVERIRAANKGKARSPEFCENCRYNALMQNRALSPAERSARARKAAINRYARVRAKKLLEGI